VDWLRTAFSWLRLSGCQVRRRHASSPVLAIDSRRAENAEGAPDVGDATIIAPWGTKAPALELFMNGSPTGERPAG
jgi:hypothetical protein